MFLLLKQCKDVLATTAFRALNKLLLEALLLLHMDFFTNKKNWDSFGLKPRDES